MAQHKTQPQAPATASPAEEQQRAFEAEEERKKREEKEAKDKRSFGMQEEEKEQLGREVHSKLGGRSFHVSSDSDKAEVDEATGVATIYPKGKSKDKDTHYTVRSTERGDEITLHVPKGKEMFSAFAQGKTKVLDMIVDTEGNFTVGVVNKEAFEKAYDGGLRQVFHTPNGEMKTLTREGVLVDAAREDTRLFGLSGDARQKEMGLQKAAQQAQATSGTPADGAVLPSAVPRPAPEANIQR